MDHVIQLRGKMEQCIEVAESMLCFILMMVKS